MLVLKCDICSLLFNGLSKMTIISAKKTHKSSDIQIRIDYITY